MPQQIAVAEAPPPAVSIAQNTGPLKLPMMLMSYEVLSKVSTDP